MAEPFLTDLRINPPPRDASQSLLKKRLTGRLFQIIPINLHLTKLSRIPYLKYYLKIYLKISFNFSMVFNSEQLQERFRKVFRAPVLKVEL